MNVGTWAAIIVAAVSAGGVIWQGGRIAAVMDRLTDLVADHEKRIREDHDQITAIRAQQNQLPGR